MTCGSPARPSEPTGRHTVLHLRRAAALARMAALIDLRSDTATRPTREMREAIASAGVYALDHHVQRLADDHARARRLAEALAAAGLPVDLEQVETNFVQLDLGPLGIPRNEALDRLRDEAGVLLSTTVHPTVVRAVTHLDVSDADIEEASEAIPRALGVLAPA